MRYDPIVLLQHKKLDSEREYRYEYGNRQEVRRRKAKRISQRIHKMVRDVLNDKKKGKQYGNGIAGPATDEVGKNEKSRKQNGKDNKNDKTVKKCKSCGLEGHVRRSHRACLHNKKNLVLQTGK